MISNWKWKLVKKTKKGFNEKIFDKHVFKYLNFNQWNHEYQVLCKKARGKECSLILYEYENYDTINRLMGYETGKQSVLTLLSTAEQFFDKGSIFLLTQSKILIILMDKERKDSYEMANKFLLSTKNPIMINEEPVMIRMKCGIEHNILSKKGKHEIINKLGKALGQSDFTKQDISIYDKKVDEEMHNYYNMLFSICNGIDHDLFHLVYQPKIRMKNNEIAGVEALLRWDNENYRNIPISDVIKMAEDADMINKITKWVIKKAMIQLKEWESIGKQIRIAINLSAKDLQDKSFLNFLKENIGLYKIDPSFLEFELTERSIINDETMVFKVLSEIKKMGIKVSMDDYGTGHNSMIYLGKSLFQFDYIKIDKMFIDEIGNSNTRTLIEGIIKTAHGWKMEIVAEGVESQEQINILKDLECDIIQGYYYSKPLLPNELNTYRKQVLYKSNI
ncbi:MAG TPA: EAL domain-containing protein [Lachnospiraceae bacterium]|nr:EAL domain-containing protein [Lachnospiraceae bacterium]